MDFEGAMERPERVEITTGVEAGMQRNTGGFR